MKQRDVVRMSHDEITEFLAGRHSMTMCTMNHDGSIHAVAMWYGFVGEAIGFETKAKSQKVLNLRRNPTMTVLVEDGETYDQLRGVELVGKGEVIEDPELLWELGVSVWSRYQMPYEESHRPFVEAMLNKRVLVRLNVERTVSWDHRKLASG